VVRSRLVPLALVLTMGSLGSVLVAQQTPEASGRVARTLAESGDAATRWGREVEQLQRAGSLRLRSSVADTMIDGRVHDRFDQYAGDVRIFGAQLIRQRSADGVQSIFGELHPSALGIALTPKLSAEQASARVVAIAGRGPIGGGVPELVVLPRAGGVYTLTWLAHARLGADVLAIFLDATTGDEVFRYSVLQHQSAVGTGTGVLGERKKLSTSQDGGAFIASDQLRPPTLTTFDLKGNFERVFDLLDGTIGPSHADLASDTDNTWTDGAIVDAHAGIGFTYDYYAARFNRRGIDDRDRPLRTIIHPADRSNPLALPGEVLGSFILNAFWCPVCGQSGNTGYLVFGEGLPTRFSTGQQNVNYFAAGFDIVAHEYTHAVTTHSSDLLYFGESGALNEAFSDIMGASAEFYLVASGRSTRPADYILGEDVFTALSPGGREGTRSMSDPLGYGYPDHYGIRYLGLGDNGGVHINSSIANHAFYLAIEGGTHRTSGLSVQGVGAANREQIERVFYRGFTAFLTPSATFAQARQATLRAASELYGDSSPAVRAVSQAWTAVGVN
jgi:Zn-dependent metalloprotease